MHVVGHIDRRSSIDDATCRCLAFDSSAVSRPMLRHPFCHRLCESWQRVSLHCPCRCRVSQLHLASAKVGRRTSDMPAADSLTVTAISLSSTAASAVAKAHRHIVRRATHTRQISPASAFNLAVRGSTSQSVMLSAVYCIGHAEASKWIQENSSWDTLVAHCVIGCASCDHANWHRVGMRGHH